MTLTAPLETASKTASSTSLSVAASASPRYVPIPSDESLRPSNSLKCSALTPFSAAASSANPSVPSGVEWPETTSLVLQPPQRLFLSMNPLDLPLRSP